MFLRPTCRCRMDNSLESWLDDPMIRDMMASDGVTETDMLLLIHRISQQRQAMSFRTPSARHDFRGEAEARE